MTDLFGQVPQSPTLSDADRRLLEEAAAYLENPAFLIRVANLVGKPAEALLDSLPERARTVVAEATSQALARGLDWAVSTLPAASEKPAYLPAKMSRFVNRHGHTVLTAITGAGGGLLGMAGLAVELPATTALMLRSIATIAREFGSDVNDAATRLECLAVFSLGSQRLEEMDSAYFTTRLSLAITLRQASHFVATHSAREISDALAKGTAPMLVRLMNAIAARFQIIVTEKMAAQALPMVGAGIGALVNAAFTDHFNRVARYHFAIVHLGRRHGHAPVQAAYEEARRARSTAARR